MEGFLSIKKTADEFGISDKLIRKWVKNGECPEFYVRVKFLVNVEMFEEKLKKLSRRKGST